jgi:hypothetical protein
MFQDIQQQNEKEDLTLVKDTVYSVLGDKDLENPEELRPVLNAFSSYVKRNHD